MKCSVVNHDFGKNSGKTTQIALWRVLNICKNNEILRTVTYSQLCT
jgi:hypothetical protein